MSDVNVRPATTADGETLLSLIEGLAAYGKLPPPDAAGSARLVAEIEREPARIRMFLAETEGRTVGYSALCETFSTFSARPKLFLEDLFVVPEARSTGAGLALFRHAAAEAVRRDCSALVWEVLDWNQLARDFYHRLGGGEVGGWLNYRLDRAGMERLLASTSA